MKFKVIKTKVKAGKYIHDGIEEDYFLNIERLVIFDKENRYFVIIDNDCCHEFFDSLRKPSIPHNQYMCSDVIPDMPFDEFISKLEEKDIYLPTWIHSFGIKPRIQSNYGLLIKNLKQINYDTKDFPHWDVALRQIGEEN